ncbi:FGGY-family carbohydrate kinase [Flavobacterium sp. MC2016-06]|jgi:sugar (pentulose or hexulose) kinase|uniref:FGGY-family carbohydrate kinase n=1 Tax=Flavobacterium sp. MC2016-06 TaxID=2676308 RepID=UPI0012BA709A|nr:FGGY-family carbohydrate kinase [Flavobacterium sp. MC2016-06]MBU3861766.1 sugar kinase [Flavobacterium sp. MC2016-06]
MKEQYFISIDNGSQSTKVYIISSKGEIIHSEIEPLKPMMFRKTGYVEHPDDDLWDSIKTALIRLMKNFKGDVNLIKGVGLCTIRCCRVFMKKDGNLAAPVMSWMDIRAYESFEDSEEIAYTCPTTGYITHRLTGELKDTAANAFQWQFPVDMETWNWSEDQNVLSNFKIPKEKLLQLQMPGTILGTVTKAAAQETGLPEGLPVVATANDKAVEALGAGLIDSSRGLFSLGTYITSMVVGKENRQAHDNYFTNLSCMPNRYLFESGGVRRGMWLISWFRDLIGEELKIKAKEKGVSPEDILEEEALKVAVGSDGLMIVPDWLAPANQSYRKGVMIGFNGQQGRGHIYRAVLEGIAFTLNNHYRLMNETLGHNPEKIIISGGGANSDLFMQIFADISGSPVVRNEMSGSAALGAAICTAVAIGCYPDFETAVKKMVKEKEEFLPDLENHKKYKQINDTVYKKLPLLLENTLKEMQTLEAE